MASYFLAKAATREQVLVLSLGVVLVLSSLV